MNTKELVLSSYTEEQLANQLAEIFEAESTEKWGETFIDFDNGIGNGQIRTISFDWGITFISCDLTFTQATQLAMNFEDPTPIDFIFVNSGIVEFQTETLPKTVLNCYQNIIIRYLADAENIYFFKKNQKVEMTFIRIVPQQYLNKKNHNVKFLHERIRKLFDQSMDEFYNHFGSYNLRIADQIKEINNCKHEGIIRTLMIEGNLNIILGLQLLEHETYLNNASLPERLNKADIEKIQQACDLIKENVSEKFIVASLARAVMLPQSKLQLGFKLLHNKTVNEYIKEIKLLQACEYLKNGNYSVSEIVYKVGFNSRSYFSRIFNDRFGMLPTKYRKNLK